MWIAKRKSAKCRCGSACAAEQNVVNTCALQSIRICLVLSAESVEWQSGTSRADVRALLWRAASSRLGECNAESYLHADAHGHVPEVQTQVGCNACPQQRSTHNQVRAVSCGMENNAMTDNAGKSMAQQRREKRICEEVIAMRLARLEDRLRDTNTAALVARMIDTKKGGAK